MIKATTIERGWPGHFIDSHNCVYHRNTLIICGKDKVIISTVGNYHPVGRNSPAQMLGLDRYYETMAFWAQDKLNGGYWEADVTKEYPFKSEWKQKSLEGTVDSRADLMHNRVCLEIRDELLAKNNNL